MENKHYKLLNNHQNIVKLLYDAIIEDTKNHKFLILSVFPYYKVTKTIDKFIRLNFCLSF